MRIVVDAMGGDHAPREPVRGAVRAAREYGCAITLVGITTQIEAELRRLKTDGLDLQVVHAPDVIGMDEHPAQAVRRKPDSSHAVGLRLVRDGHAAAFVTAGHSGAAMAGASFILGRIAHIDRPALVAVMPRLQDRPLILLDVGATTDCKPEYLHQFALMGSIYTEYALGIPNPRIGLLSNGEEDIKGNRLVQETHVLLRESQLNFVGNVEPKDLLVNDVADLAVCDGFVGNLILKMGEATISSATRMAIRELQRGLRLRVLIGIAPVAGLALAARAGRWQVLAGAGIGAAGVAGLLLYPAHRLRQKTDYRVYGGVPLLGVKGVVIIAHGRSDALAIANAVRRAQETHESNVTGLIEGAIQRIAVSAAN